MLGVDRCANTYISNAPPFAWHLCYDNFVSITNVQCKQTVPTHHSADLAVCLCVCRPVSMLYRSRASRTGLLSSSSSQVACNPPLQYSMLLPPQLQLSVASHTAWPSQLQSSSPCSLHAAPAPGRTAAASASSRANRHRLGAASNDQSGTEGTSSSSSSSGDGGQPNNSSSGGSSSSSGGQLSAESEAWALMGRVVSSDRLVLGQVRSKLLLPNE
jgi:uncharacterized membrane protein YgcG